MLPREVDKVDANSQVTFCVVFLSHFSSNFSSDFSSDFVDLPKLHLLCVLMFTESPNAAEIGDS